MNIIINKLKNIFNYMFFFIKVIKNKKKMYDIIKNIDYDLNKNKSKNRNNICILLSAGTSTRFENTIPKQLFIYENKPLIEYSINLLLSQSSYISHIIIISNSKCINEIENIIKNIIKNNIKNNTNTKIEIIINDINCRLESIDCGLNFIQNNIKQNIENIIIHDVARPFVSQDYIKNILLNTKYYSQYCLKLTNGLMYYDYTTLDRDKYIELCTPICMNYKIFEFIFINFISKKNRYVYEFIDILKIYNINIDLFYGKYKFLRKITFSDDL